MDTDPGLLGSQGAAGPAQDETCWLSSTASEGPCPSRAPQDPTMNPSRALVGSLADGTDSSGYKVNGLPGLEDD